MAGPERLEGRPQQPDHIQVTEKSPPHPKTTHNPLAQKLQTDCLEISPENVEYQQLLTRIDQAPDIRSDRLKKIQQALENGTYHIDSNLVADGIIQDILNDEKASPRHAKRPPTT